MRHPTPVSPGRLRSVAAIVACLGLSVPRHLRPPLNIGTCVCGLHSWVINHKSVRTWCLSSSLTNGMEECRECQLSSADFLVQPWRSPEDGQNSRQLFYQRTLWHGSRGTPHNGHTYRQLYQHLKFARLPVLWWIASRNCSLATVCAHLYIILFVLMGSPAAAAPLSTETWVGARAHSVEVACSGQFFHRLRSCVQPFMSSLGEQPLTTSLTLGKHLCLKYQLALLCVHSVLTECPGEDNIRQVQTTLGSHRVVQINHLCSIASQSHKYSADTEKTVLRHLQHRQDVAENASHSQRPQALIQFLMTTAGVHDNGLHTTVTHPPSPSLATSARPVSTPSPSLATSARPVSTPSLSLATSARPVSTPSPSLATSARPVSTTQAPSRDHRSDSGSHDMTLNIHDFVNNYQFHKSPVVDTGGSSNSLLQIVVATSAGDATRLHLSLSFVVFVGFILTVH